MTKQVVERAVLEHDTHDVIELLAAALCHNRPPGLLTLAVDEILPDQTDLWMQLRGHLTGVDDAYAVGENRARFLHRKRRSDSRREALMAQEEAAGSGVLTYFDREITRSLEDFKDPSQEWRRLFSELLGTFFLVLVAAGGGMMGQAFPDTISRTAAVVAPGLMVMAIIMFMGKVSGAHLNPAVSIAFSLRGDFPWRRVPGYIVVQLAGATLACLFLRWVIDVSATYGSNYPAAGYSAGDAFLMEAVLTLGLVSVILGTASGAQNIGIFGAIGVGAYIALAGLWGSPISGASMNPARTFGPDLVGTDFTSYWVYVAGPILGATLAVGAAWILRGAGGGRAGSGAAQGDIQTEVEHPGKA
jgi:aquaporin Z